MTKSKCSASAIVVPLIFVIYLLITCVAGASVTAISPLTKI